MAPQKPQETGKQRAARIPLDYYKHGDTIERWKLHLAGVAVLATLAWMGASWALSGQDDFQSSRGPVASVHQNWDTQCQACHEPFTSISSHSWKTPFLGDATVSNKKCQACHSGADHHKGQSPDLSCASCHRDHRGREASLVALPDSDCTQCHNKLSQHFGERMQSDVPDVVDKFAKGSHPRFRSLAKDPGKLEFNHRLHLSPGMALREGTQVGGTIKTLGQIPVPFRNRYRGEQTDKADTAPVQLQCASCHQQDVGDQAVFAPRKKSPGLRGSGAYMLPINYANHCQACHPLTVDHKPAQGNEPQLAVPHGWQPKDIHLFLDDYFTSKYARSFWQEEAAKPKKDRPLPGGVIKTPVPATELEKAQKAIKTAESYLYQGNPGSPCATRSTNRWAALFKLCRPTCHRSGSSMRSSITPPTAP